MLAGHFYNPEEDQELRSRLERIPGLEQFEVPSIVYHYTSKDGFDSIMKDFPNSLSLTHAKFMNDVREYELGEKLVELYLERKYQNQYQKTWHYPDDETLTKLFCANLPWILSTTAVESSPHHWKNYTPNGGYALGLKVEAVISNLKSPKADKQDSESSWADECGVAFIPCVYINHRNFEKIIKWLKTGSELPQNTKEIRQRVFGDRWNNEETISSQENSIQTFIALEGVIAYLCRCESCENPCSDEMQKRFRLAACLVGSMIKSGSYRREKEWRFVVVLPSEYVNQYTTMEELGVHPIAYKPRIPLFKTRLEKVDILEKVVVSPEKTDLAGKARKNLDSKSLRHFAVISDRGC